VKSNWRDMFDRALPMFLPYKSNARYTAAKADLQRRRSGIPTVHRLLILERFPQPRWKKGQKIGHCLFDLGHSALCLKGGRFREARGVCS